MVNRFINHSKRIYSLLFEKNPETVCERSNRLVRRINNIIIAQYYVIRCIYTNKINEIETQNNEYINFVIRLSFYKRTVNLIGRNKY